VTCSKAQANLDSLLVIREDDSQIESVITNAFHDYITAGFLHTKPDTAFTILEKLLSHIEKPLPKSQGIECGPIQGSRSDLS
jgi:hypothetical protein